MCNAYRNISAIKLNFIHNLFLAPFIDSLPLQSSKYLLNYG